MSKRKHRQIEPQVCVTRNGSRGFQFDTRKRYPSPSGATLVVRKEKGKRLGLKTLTTIQKGKKIGDFIIASYSEDKDPDNYCFRQGDRYCVTDPLCLMNKINYDEFKKNRNCRFGQPNNGRIPVLSTRTINTGEFLNVAYGDKKHILKIRLLHKKNRTYSVKKYKQKRRGSRNCQEIDNNDRCNVCNIRGELVCCDTCPKSFCSDHCSDDILRLNVDTPYFCNECLGKRIPYPNRFT